MATGKGLRRKRRIVWAVLIALAAVGWWQHRIVQAAYARLALEFTRLEDRPDIRYQPGQEKRARAVAGMLEESIRTVENALRINMRSPGVYCMATEQDYSAFTAAPGSRGACTVLREVCALAVVGLLVSVPIALSASRLVQSFLFQVKPNDPYTIVTAAGVLVAAALLAGYGPAHRAARISPAIALRAD